MVKPEYKILFTFKDRSLLVAGTYQLEIYGIISPSNHQNGNLQIVYEREYDKTYTLITSPDVLFPSLSDQITSNIKLESFYNTEGLEQKLVFTIVNSQKQVDDKMIWIINFPSYYSENPFSFEHVFNFQQYCLIDSTPIACKVDPITPYQIIISQSPKIIDP